MGVKIEEEEYGNDPLNSPSKEWYQTEKSWANDTIASAWEEELNPSQDNKMMIESTRWPRVKKDGEKEKGGGRGSEDQYQAY